MVRLVIGLAAALAAASFASGGIASAQSAGGIGLRPAHIDENDPATRAYFKPTVAAGGTFHDEVVVSNTSDAAVDLIVAGVDGLTGQTAGAVYANRQDPVRKAGTWLSPDAATMTVAPHTEANMGFTVTVPGDAAPGDHLAGIAFENAHPTSSGGNFSVTQVVRAVMGVQVVVPGDAVFHMHVDSVTLEALPGTEVASAVIRMGNDGGKLGKPDVSVTVSGPDRYHKTVERQVDTILPGDTIDFPFNWPDTLKPGQYTVVASTSDSSGSAATTRGDADLAKPLAGVDAPTNLPLVSARPDDSSNSTTLVVVLAVLVGVAGIGGGILIGRRGRRAAPSDT